MMMTDIEMAAARARRIEADIEKMEEAASTLINWLLDHPEYPGRAQALDVVNRLRTAATD